jgi:solute carrier family 15 (peptide/histidine transporter), member 3/4
VSPVAVVVGVSGHHLSSVLVSIVNSATELAGHWPWLHGDNLNHYHVERFY